jgi:hypothetical protein
MAEFKTPTEAQFRARTIAPSGVIATSASYDAKSKAVVIGLASGIRVAFPLAVLPGLERAAPEDLKALLIEGGGYGLHVPALDADISIPQLFKDQLGAEGMLKGQRRATASRNNGRLGGRPKKTGQAA